MIHVLGLATITNLHCTHGNRDIVGLRRAACGTGLEMTMGLSVVAVNRKIMTGGAVHPVTRTFASRHVDGCSGFPRWVGNPLHVQRTLSYEHDEHVFGCVGRIKDAHIPSYKTRRTAQYVPIDFKHSKCGMITVHYCPKSTIYTATHFEYNYTTDSSSQCSMMCG